MNKEAHLALLIAQMALENMPTSTIDFFKNIYPGLTSIPYLSRSEMAEYAHMTSQAAKRHVHRLERAGYIKRHHYRAWKFQDTCLNDRTLVKLLRAASTLQPNYA